MTAPPARHRPVAAALLVLALMVFGAPWSTSHVVLAQSYSLFASVVDADGNPVTDLGPDELRVQWDGVDCLTLSVESVDMPVRVSFFVDNAEGGLEALQHVREGLKDVLDILPPEVEIGLLTLARQPRWVARHTTDRAELERGIDLMVPDGGTAARFRDALVEEAGRVAEDSERQYLPVVVIVGSDGLEGSGTLQRHYEEMVNRMLENSVTVHALMFISGQADVGGRPSANQGQALQVAMNVTDLTRGSYQQLNVANGFRRMLPELAEDIARKHRLARTQYRVLYDPPPGAPDALAVSVAVARPGLQLTATADGNVP